MLYPDLERQQCKARELKIRESCAHDRLVQKLKEEAADKRARPTGHTRGKHRLTPLHWFGLHGALLLW